MTSAIAKTSSNSTVSPCHMLNDPIPRPPSSYRDGPARACLQPYACHEHPGYPAAPGGDEGIVAAKIRLPAAAKPPSTAGTSIRGTSTGKGCQTRENHRAWRPAREPDAATLPPWRFHTTKTHSGPRISLQIVSRLRSFVGSTEWSNSRRGLGTKHKSKSRSLDCFRTRALNDPYWACSMTDRKGPIRSHHTYR